MADIKRRSRGNFVRLLQQMLNTLGYQLEVDGYFGKITEEAVKDFQASNALMIDGVVGVKTWQTLNEKVNAPAGTKFVSEKDFVKAAKELDVDIAAVKAVQKVETGGRSGFLINGKAVILFEGHIFWRQLKDRGIDPQGLRAGNESILYPSWTQKYYKGGVAEYERLEKAKKINIEAALCSASWGMFQIMGFNFALCGYPSVDAYVKDQQISEGKQLMAFVNFLKNSNCLKKLQILDWRGFARCYNGPGYEKNRYHTKLQKAYSDFRQD